MIRRVGWFVIALTLSFSVGTQVLAQQFGELKRLSLEELMHLEITSASRKAEQFSEAATAIDVITQDEIRRSGFPTIPEALRLATGLQVARVGAQTWAISARGFNITTANKLQVLMDGRILYSPLFSGVFWDVQDTLLDDLDRIEVIRGPGATVWGANAVNGVINIMTKNAKETQGVLLLGGAGTEERGFGGIRYGGKIGENTFFRTYAKYFKRDSLVFANGDDAQDGWQMGRGGFRIDSDMSSNDSVTLQGDVYYGLLGRSTGDDTAVGGGNIIGRWQRRFSDQSSLQLQLYYDRTERRIPDVFEEDRDTYDMDFQHRFLLGKRHDIVWGFNYNVSTDAIENSETVAFIPARRTVQLVSGFVQDDITLISERLGVILGSKFEYNDFTGFEVQPTARLVWTPTERHTLWTAVSRAVRTPTRIDDDFRFTPESGMLTIRGDREFKAEEVLAFELGYRVQPHATISVDVATFYNLYDNLRSQEPEPPTGLPLVLRNTLEGETYGLEMTVKYQPAVWWNLKVSYTYLQTHLRREAGSQDPLGGVAEGNDPDHWFMIYSFLDLPANLEFDTILRYVGELPDPRVPSYLTLDLRLAWEPLPNLALSISGHNLLGNRHREFGQPSPTAAEVQRSVYGMVTWRF